MCFTELYTSVQSVLREESPESFEQLNQILNL
jgi:hypothetical protein